MLSQHKSVDNVSLTYYNVDVTNKQVDHPPRTRKETITIGTFEKIEAVLLKNIEALGNVLNEAARIDAKSAINACREINECAKAYQSVHLCAQIEKGVYMPNYLSGFCADEEPREETAE